MIEQVLRRSNMLRAMYKVQKKYGSAGVDHMPLTKLSELMAIDQNELTNKVRSGKYLPQTILGERYPKKTGRNDCWAFQPLLTVYCNKPSYR